MRNQVRTILLLGVLSAVLISIGGAIGTGWLYGALVFSLAMNLGAYYFSDRIVLRTSGAREVSAAEAPQLHALVAEVAHAAGLPMPKVCIVPSEMPNAFATGRNPSKGVVAVTEGLMRLLDRRELRGVIAHEMAHIGNRDTLVATVAASFAAAVSYLANIVQFGVLFGGGQQSESEGGGGGLASTLALALFGPVAAMLIQMGISRSREFLADETAARITGDPEALARALARLQRGGEAALEHGAAGMSPASASLAIVNPLAGGIASWFSTHPPIEARIQRLMHLSGRSTFAA